MVSPIFTGTIYTGQQYFLELTYMDEDGSATVHAYAYNYQSASWLGENDAYTQFQWSTNPVYVGTAAWVDIAGQQSSKYWVSQPASDGYMNGLFSGSGYCPSAHFNELTSNHGATFEGDTIGCGGYNGFDFMSWPVVPCCGGQLYLGFDNMTVPNSQKIVISGWFIKNDTFYSQGLQQGRSYIKLYLINPSTWSVITSVVLMDYTYNNAQWYYKNYTWNLAGIVNPGTMVKIGVGRGDAWTTDWSLQYFTAQVVVTPG
ncbi:MAG: hypothetical protein ABSB56_08620 [Nitrososphaerales archaeon]